MVHLLRGILHHSSGYGFINPIPKIFVVLYPNSNKFAQILNSDFNQIKNSTQEDCNVWSFQHAATLHLS